MGGKYTGEIGFDLYERYRDTDYEIYYHHGKKSPNCYKPTPFFDECSDASKLGYVDIVVIDKIKKKAILVCEIEETSNAPKTIIGDFMNIVLSDQISIDSTPYDYDRDIVFILGTKINCKGAGKKKTQNICQKLKQINEKVGNKKIELIPISKDDAEKLTKKVKEMIISKLDS